MSTNCFKMIDLIDWKYYYRKTIKELQIYDFNHRHKREKNNRD